MVEYVIAFEVFGLELATDALFQTANAEAAAPRLHARRFPDLVFNNVDFALDGYRHRHVAVALHQELGQLAGRRSRERVVAAVNAKAALRIDALHAQGLFLDVKD